MKIDASSWPEYQSIKIVRALQIIDVRLTYLGIERGARQDAVLTLANGEQVTIEDVTKVFARFKPEAGDYAVVYADGYVSFSPKAPFEEGYVPKAAHSGLKGSISGP